VFSPRSPRLRVKFPPNSFALPPNLLIGNINFEESALIAGGNEFFWAFLKSSRIAENCLTQVVALMNGEKNPHGKNIQNENDRSGYAFDHRRGDRGYYVCPVFHAL
jgi:hypothetical protein